MTKKKLKTFDKEARKKAKTPDELLEQLRSEILFRIDTIIEICSFMQKSAKEQGVELNWKGSKERKEMVKK